MSYKNKYLKYKSKYLHLKKLQRGGAVPQPEEQQKINESLKNMSMSDLVSFDLNDVNKNIKTTVLQRHRLDNSYLKNLTVLEDMGSGQFGSAKKLLVNNDIKKGDQTLPKDTIVLGKYIQFTPENQGDILSQLENEIFAYSTISLTDCNLPKLYGYFDSIVENGKTYYLMLVQFTEGDNMLNTIMKNNLSLSNQNDINQLTKWINDIENTLNCLHKYDISHRDVKLDNVIITPDNRAVLIDYGLTCRFLTFCSRKHYKSYTSPLKVDMLYSDHQFITTEKTNDFYAVGILILDALSKMKEYIGNYPEKILFSDVVSNNDEPYGTIMNFIGKVYREYPNIKPLTDKAFEYIKNGTPEDQRKISLSLTSSGTGSQVSAAEIKDAYVGVFSAPMNKSGESLGRSGEYKSLSASSFPSLKLSDEYKSLSRSIDSFRK